MDELSELPFLDSVVRETLRLHAPVPMSKRVAARDDVIPLQTPYTDIRGKIHDSIRYALIICGRQLSAHDLSDVLQNP